MNNTSARSVSSIWRQILISAVITMALIVGLGVAKGGWLVAIVILVVGALVALALHGPYAILLAWIALAPFTQGRMIDPGVGIPNISVDRVLLLLAFFFALSRVLAGSKTLRGVGVETVSLLVFLGWGVISILFRRQAQPISQLGMFFQQFFLPITAYWIVLQEVTSERQVSKLLYISMIVLIILSLPVPLEELTGTTIFGATSESVAGIIRVQSFTRAPWELGPIAGVLLAFSIPVLLNGSKLGRKMLGMVAMFLGCATISLTFLRVSWLAMIAIFLITSAFIPRLRRWVYPILTLTVIIVLVNWPTIVQSGFWTDRVANIDNIIRRQIVLKQQLEMLTQNLLFGIGPQLNPTYYYTYGGYFALSHNMYISVLLDFGLPGLFYFLPIFLILRRSIMTYKYLPSGSVVSKELVVSLWGAAVVFLLHAFSLETRLFILPNTLFWITMGLLRNAEEISRDERTDQP